MSSKAVEPVAPALGSDQSFYETKAQRYRSEGYNRVVLKRVKASLPPGGRVLDIGCGSGVLLSMLEGHAGFRVGVELSETAAAEARRVADEVVTAPVNTDLPFAMASFDVVVCADVLEHLADPSSALSWAATYCRPGGAVVVSVPNVANWEARFRLLRGIWRYEVIGLFDSGHLRFFTKTTLLEMVEAAGLVVQSCVPARVPHLSSQLGILGHMPLPLRHVIDKAWAVVGYGLAMRWPGLFAYQLVCTARPPAAEAGRNAQADRRQ